MLFQSNFCKVLQAAALFSTCGEPQLPQMRRLIQDHLAFKIRVIFEHVLYSCNLKVYHALTLAYV